MITAEILHWACAVGYAAFATLILLQSRRSRTAVILSLTALATAIWAAATALAWGEVPPMTADMFDLARALAWYGFVLHLYRRVIPADSSGRIFSTMGLVALIMIVLLGVVAIGTPFGGDTLLLAVVLARLGIAVCALLLLENLWLNVTSDARWHVGLACVALGALFIYDIVLASDFVLTRVESPALAAGHPLTSLVAIPLLGLSAARNRGWRIDIHVSRTAAFHSATLVVSGLFFLSLAAAGEIVRRSGLGGDGADWGEVGEIGLVFSGVLAAGVLLTSGSARSWVRATVVDHFFSHRYDYRREWIRCINTLAAPETYVPLHVRAIRAVAEIVDSPGGALFLCDGSGMALQWSGSWNMESATQPLLRDHPLAVALRQAGAKGSGVVDMAPWQGAPTAAALPEPTWLAVPLGSGDDLIGFILLAHPRVEFRLDREVHDLVRTVGRMVTSLIAEQRLTETLTQTRQLHEYGKRFSFVAHDIKNISSQLSMLLANAESHIANPDFQRDMLGTVRASVQKIATLLRRLQEPERDLVNTVIAPVERLSTLLAVCGRGRAVSFALDSEGAQGSVKMSAAAFDAVLTHLLENAADASPAGSVIGVRLRQEARRLVIDIVDRGRGMSPEFVRDQLFRPFATAKAGGTGIGVFQARELLRQAGGDLMALSEAGAGTTMRLLMPLAFADAEPTARIA